MGIVQRLLLNSHGLASVLASRDVRAALEHKAEAVLKAADARVPVRTGDLKASGHVEMDETDRAVARVVYDSDHAQVVNARTGFLSSSIDAAKRA